MNTNNSLSGASSSLSGASSSLSGASSSLSGASDVRPKLSALIKDMCPNGVEFKKLGECCELKRGSTITEKDAIAGDIPVIAGGQKPAYYHNQSNREGKNITVAGSGAYAGYVAYWEQPIFVSDAFTITPKDERLDIKFVYYYLTNMQDAIHHTKKGSGVPHVHPSSISGFPIPLPPLEIQKKIVECLDKFSALAAELQAELQLRRKQYEYYRTQLLTPHSDCNSADKSDDCNWEWKTLGEICDIKGRIGFRGYTRADQVEMGEGAISLSPANIKNSTITYDDCTYITWEKYEESPEIMVEEGDVIFCKTASVGKTAFIQNLPEKATINPQLVLLKNIKCNNKYLSYYLQTDAVQNAVKQYQGVGSVPNVSQAKLSEVKIALPPLAEQERIVSILDKFEALTTSLSDGIPAEQAAQQKRYEYYRDLLLTFPRKEV